MSTETFLPELIDELKDAAAVLRYFDAPVCAEAVEKTVLLLGQVSEKLTDATIARAIFEHPLMLAVERCASTRWLTKSEQAVVVQTILKLAALAPEDPRPASSSSNLTE